MEKTFLLLTETQWGWLAAIIIALVIAYFLFKHLLKLALVIILIVLAVAGYHYFQDPKNLPDKMAGYTKETVEKTMALPEKAKELKTGVQNFIDRVTKLLDWERWLSTLTGEPPADKEAVAEPPQKK